jgi:hypothetical protein
VNLAKYFLAAAMCSLAMPVGSSPSPPDYAIAVNPDGSMATGRNATGASHDSTGAYTVTFNNSLSACAVTASIGSNVAGVMSPAGMVAVAFAAGNPLALSVRTFDANGAAADRGFHLIAACLR